MKKSIYIFIFILMFSSFANAKMIDENKIGVGGDKSDIVSVANNNGESKFPALSAGGMIDTNSLPVDDAFFVDAKIINNEIKAVFKPHDGYYFYKDSIE